MADKKDRTIAVKVDEELHRPVRVKLAEEDRSFQDLIPDLLRQWLTSEAQPLPELTEIAHILQGPDTTEALALKSSIKVALNAYRKQQNAAKATSAGPHDQRRKTGS